MQSELHDRLEYLVNYSSQLIFVSGDSIAEQQRTLEAFVYRQKENTELAFLTASQTMELSDYRRQLCRQLLGETVGSFVRPLNELLADLNHHSGPVLITLTQAEHIPDKLLQELWDLVLQSRFASNKQHLNVLLFGESRWAEKAKKWLPAKNTDTPLLISSQSVSRDQYSSEIDKLLTERRAAFERHVQQRDTAQLPAPVNRLRSPWFIMAIVVLFISSFAALLAWQYGASLSTLFAPLDEPITDNQTQKVTLPEEQPQTTPTYIIESDTSETATVSPPPSQAEVQTQVQANVANTSDGFVTSWDQAVKDLEKSSSASTPAAVDDNINAADVTPTVPEPANQNDDTAEIVLANPTTTANTAQNEPETPQPVTAEVNTLPLANDTLRNTLAQSQYYLQLSGLKDPTLMADFIRDNGLTNQVLVYQTQRYGGDWYVVLWHEPYTSIRAARNSVNDLPAFNGKDKAFVKGSLQILRELDNNTARSN